MLFSRPSLPRPPIRHTPRVTGCRNFHFLNFSFGSVGGEFRFIFNMGSGVNGHVIVFVYIMIIIHALFTLGKLWR